MITESVIAFLAAVLVSLAIGVYFGATFMSAYRDQNPRSARFNDGLTPMDPQWHISGPGSFRPNDDD